jgi:hypothetical protein
MAGPRGRRRCSTGPDRVPTTQRGGRLLTVGLAVTVVPGGLPEWSSRPGQGRKSDNMNAPDVASGRDCADRVFETLSGQCVLG